MIENPFYSPEVHGSYEHFDLGDLVLEAGRAMLRRSMRPAGTCAGSGWKPLRARGRHRPPQTSSSKQRSGTHATGAPARTGDRHVNV